MPDWPLNELFESGRIRQALKAQKAHYVYILFRPGPIPFYVGKGVADRCLQHEAEARTTKRLSHKLNVIRSLHRSGQPVLYHLDSWHDSEAEAHKRERDLILLIGRHDLGRGPLTNQTDGGEGASNPSEESRRRRRDSLSGENAEDWERQIANRFFQQLCSVGSVTLKPANTWRGAEGLWRNRKNFPMTTRQAATLAASAISNRVMLEAGALLPRRLPVEEAELILENGVGRDMLSSGMAQLAVDKPTYEIFSLTESGFRYMTSALGRDMLIDAGVLMPE